MRLEVVFLRVSLALAACTAASADYHFYGVSFGEFLDDNDTLWGAVAPYPEWDPSRCTLRDDFALWDEDRNDGRDSVYDDLLWYGDNLQSGDVLVFSYTYHGGWDYPDGLYNPSDEGSTARPQINDPTPSASAPYAGDEWLPDPGTGGLTGLLDDELTDALAGFDAGVEVVVISSACHSGGWVGGSHDLDTSAPANNSGLYALLGAPEQATCVAIKEDEQQQYFDVLLTESLVNSLAPFMTISEWYQAATLYGESAYYTGQRPWDSSPTDYYFWPSADWVPSTHEQTYYDFANDDLDRWGWEGTYLQLRPVGFSTLDGYHDNPMATPEPATAAMVILGVAGLGAVLRRRRAGEGVS
ncbi:MAG: PEP-CTERM sorting domain-containing protein [Armatimonadota bacterium]|nr:PEP-CTERM sorting domain-containing protein [Armatimonadota bacterium]